MDEQLSDIAALVRRAAGGDRGAFAAVIDAHERPALAIAYATVGCAATAADVVQEAFLRAWQRLGELDDPSRFGAWLARIVRNLSVDAIRRRPRTEVAVEPEHLAALPSAAPEDAAQTAETRQQINDALAQLDEVTRVIVTLRYYQNLSSRQISGLVGLSPAAVDMRLSRARSELRKRLGSCRETGADGMALDTVACAGGDAG